MKIQTNLASTFESFLKEHPEILGKKEEIYFQESINPQAFLLNDNDGKLDISLIGKQIILNQYQHNYIIAKALKCIEIIEQHVGKLAEEASIKKINDRNNKIGASKRKTTKDFNIQAYIKCCEEINISCPTLAELKESSGISISQWQRKLHDISFLVDLEKEIEKKINLSKTDEKKGYWNRVRIDVSDKSERLSQQYYENKNKEILYEAESEQNWEM